jgi:hypothetical protein
MPGLFAFHPFIARKIAMTHLSYANPIRKSYKSAVGSFGATTATESFIGPKGRKGVVRDIEVFLTVDATGTTAVPEIDVGTTSGDTTYARFRLGTTATAGYTATATPKRARPLVTGSGAAQTYSDFTGHVALETTFIPADTAFVITNKQGTGSGAGTGYSVVEIEWF